MDDLSLSPKFLQNLILRTRALMSEQGQSSDDEGNYTDEKDPETARAGGADLTRAELANEIDDLEPDQQAELVALMWVGRGDLEPEEWLDALSLAGERNDVSTAEYLLAHPHLAEHWDEGLDRLLDGTAVVESGEY